MSETNATVARTGITGRSEPTVHADAASTPRVIWNSGSKSNELLNVFVGMNGYAKIAPESTQALGGVAPNCNIVRLFTQTSVAVVGVA